MSISQATRTFICVMKNFNFLIGDVNLNDKWIENRIKKCDIIIPLAAIATPKIYIFGTHKT